MIEPEDLDGRTHDRGLRDNMPEIFPHEDAYIGLTGYLTKISQELDSDNVNVYSRFSERTSELRSAFEHFFDQIDNALYNLDNDKRDLAEKHVEKARDSYYEALEACERFYGGSILGEIDGLERPEEYIEEVFTALESVEELVEVENDMADVETRLDRSTV